jgi:predicted ester cyclase
MSAEQNKTIIRRWVEGFNANNMNRLEALADELYSADFVVHNDAEPAAAIGREGVKRFVRNALKNTPDMQLTIRELLAEGDQAASRLTMSGTSASTGQPVRLMIMQIWRFVGSQIAELWQITIPAQRLS